MRSEGAGKSKTKEDRQADLRQLAARVEAEPSPEAYFEYGRRLMEAESYEDAVTWLEQAAVYGCRQPEARMHIARCFAALGRNEEGLRALGKAIKLDKNNTVSDAQKGSLYFDLGDYGKAFPLLEKSLSQGAYDSEILIRFAECLAFLGHVAEIGDFIAGHEALDADAEGLTPGQLHRIGVLWNGINHHDEARAYLNTACDQEPGNIEFLENLLVSLDAEKDGRRAALVVLRRAAGSLKDNSGISEGLSLADMFMKRGFYDDASMRYRKTLQRARDGSLCKKADEAHILDKYAMSLLALERFDEARESLFDAAGLDPENIDCRLHQVDVLIAEGRREDAGEQALQILRDAIGKSREQDSRDKPSRTGHVAKAGEYYRRAVKIGHAEEGDLIFGNGPEI